MKKKILPLLTLVFSMNIPVLLAQDQTPEPLYMSKTATPIDDDRVKLTLESFVSGNNSDSDIVIVMDMSVSMGYSVSGTGETYAMERKQTEETKISSEVKQKTAKTSAAMSATTKAAKKKNNVSAHSRNWTYSNLKTYNYPFFLYEGKYYKVQRGNDLGENQNIRALWIDTPDGRKYLNGSTLSDDPGTVTTDTGTIFKGSLYYGYTWTNIVAGTTPAGETSVSYLYEGEYYPVKRNRFDADGTLNDSGSIYALWIDTPDGVRFLYGSGLRDQLDPSVTDDDYYLYYGDLYDSGWTYSGIDGPWYYDHNGTYYPVHKTQEGQAYTLWIEVNGDKMYLKGEGLSDDYVHSVKADNQSIYFGSLYKGGWYYDNFTTEYNYLLEGKYYPVKRDRFNADGTPNSSGSVYAVFIEMQDGTRKFLSGNGLQDKPYELVTSSGAAGGIFTGTLYSGGWTYANVKGDNVYYYLYQGVYYPVKRADNLSDGHGGNSARALWIEMSGNPKYLNGEGLADDYMHSVSSNSQGIFYGMLYTGGWSYTNLQYGNTNGNAANQWYYLHEGNYYPVRRANNLGSGSNVRAMWICPDPSDPNTKKYLSGQSLVDDFDPSVTSDTQILYLGPLYKGWTRADVGASFYYKEGNNYYQISSVDNVLVNGVSTHQLSVTKDNTTYYLNGKTITQTPNPYAAVTNDVSLYFGELYTKQATHRRADYLKEALEVLLDALSADAKKDGLHNRVALVEFSYAKWETGTDINHPYLEAFPLSGASSHVISDFKDITVQGNLDAMKNALALPHSFLGGSYYRYGFSLANALFMRELGAETGTDFNNNGVIESFEVPTLTGQAHTNYSKRPRIVILIGDCEAADRAEATSWATTLKSDLPAGADANIFVVYTSGTTSASQTDSAEWASSDDMVTQAQYNDTLIEALRKLSKDIRKALIELGAGTVVQDAIADGFEIPETASDRIKVYTADYVSGVTKEEMQFATPVLSDLTPTVSTEDGHQVVRVSGFDFSENYCGTVLGVKHGKKLILEIEVDRTSAVGGPSTVTNVAESSGIKDAEGNFLSNFTTSSTSYLPVNIQIQKTGLVKGESAVFTVQPVDENGEVITSVLVNEETVPVKPHRVILTGNDSGTPVTATLKHLNGNCYWLVTEEGWSWDYEVNEGNPSLSTATELVNPLVFANVKQNTAIKAAESKVSNDFGAASSVTVNSRD